MNRLNRVEPLFTLMCCSVELRAVPRWWPSLLPVMGKVHHATKCYQLQSWSYDDHTHDHVSTYLTHLLLVRRKLKQMRKGSQKCHSHSLIVSCQPLLEGLLLHVHPWGWNATQAADRVAGAFNHYNIINNLAAWIGVACVSSISRSVLYIIFIHNFAETQVYQYVMIFRKCITLVMIVHSFKSHLKITLQGPPHFPYLWKCIGLLVCDIEEGLCPCSPSAISNDIKWQWQIPQLQLIADFLPGKLTMSFSWQSEG